MEIHVLASGSKGNAAFVYEDHCGILIDCGISRKQLLFRLKEVGFEEKDINYVLLTHDHHDHDKNINIFNPDQIYTAPKNIKGIDEEHTLVPYEHKQLGNFDILTLRTSHDASDPIGFIITGNESLCYMTDTGYVSVKNRKYMKNKNYYVIESNHDVEMLMATNRPIFLKNRILSDNGHMNNEYSANLMVDMIGDDTKEIILAHLSEQANTKEIALNTYYRIFEDFNVDFDLKYLKVASQVSVVSGGKHED